MRLITAYPGDRNVKTKYIMYCNKRTLELFKKLRDFLDGCKSYTELGVEFPCIWFFLDDPDEANKMYEIFGEYIMPGNEDGPMA